MDTVSLSISPSCSDRPRNTYTEYGHESLVFKKLGHKSALNFIFSETILNQTKMDYDMPYDPYDLANLRNVAPAQDN